MQRKVILYRGCICFEVVVFLFFFSKVHLHRKGLDPEGLYGVFVRTLFELLDFAVRCVRCHVSVR